MARVNSNAFGSDAFTVSYHTQLTVQEYSIPSDIFHTVSQPCSAANNVHVSNGACMCNANYVEEAGGPDKKCACIKEGFVERDGRCMVRFFRRLFRVV